MKKKTIRYKLNIKNYKIIHRQLKEMIQQIRMNVRYKVPVLLKKKLKIRHRRVSRTNQMAPYKKSYQRKGLSLLQKMRLPVHRTYCGLEY